MDQLVVIIDDQEVVAELTKNLLENAGITNIETYTDSSAALYRINQVQPDVVISDYRMPGMNGVELLQAAKVKNPQIFGMLMTGEQDFNGTDDFPVFPKNYDSIGKMINCVCDHLRRN